MLNDETHNGDSTYYRYDKDTGTFTYIGTAGPSVVQTTGQSTTDVMSQKAVTDIIGDIESALHAINNGGN